MQTEGGGRRAEGGRTDDRGRRTEDGRGENERRGRGGGRRAEDGGRRGDFHRFMFTADAKRRRAAALQNLAEVREARGRSRQRLGVRCPCTAFQWGRDKGSRDKGEATKVRRQRGGESPKETKESEKGKQDQVGRGRSAWRSFMRRPEFMRARRSAYRYRHRDRTSKRSTLRRVRLTRPVVRLLERHGEEEGGAVVRL
jgi:hypothetical protein